MGGASEACGSTEPIASLRAMGKLSVDSEALEEGDSALPVVKYVMIGLIRDRRNMTHSFIKLQYHIVFSTEGFLPLIKPEWEPRLFE